jgi:hypothetical protein
VGAVIGERVLVEVRLAVERHARKTALYSVCSSRSAKRASPVASSSRWFHITPPIAAQVSVYARSLGSS